MKTKFKTLKSLDMNAIELTQSKLTKNEVTEIECTKSELPQNDATKGFFQLQHCVFQLKELQNLSGDAFRVFLFLSSRAWRFKDSSGELRASYSYIEMCTGVSRATAGRILLELREQKLVTLIELNHKKGNLFRISPCAVKETKNELTQIETPQIKLTKNEQVVDAKRDCSDLKMSTHPAQNEVEIININKFNNLSKELLKYFEKLLPKKQQSEARALKELLLKFSMEDIEKAFIYVKERGEPRTGNPVHSPMAFLSIAIHEVVEKLFLSDERKKIAATIEASLRISGQVRAKEEAQELELEKRAQAAFLQKFPEEENRARVLEEFFSRNVFYQKIPKEIARKQAIREWFEGEQRSA